MSLLCYSNEKQLVADTKKMPTASVEFKLPFIIQVNRKQLSQKHRECGPAHMSRDEQAVQDLICFKEFNCFSFDPASSALRTLQSAIPATPKLIQDFKKAKQDGEAQLKVFMFTCTFCANKALQLQVVVIAIWFTHTSAPLWAYIH